MSKLAEAITAELTGDKKVSRMRYLTTESFQQPPSGFNLRNGYAMVATFKHVAWVDDITHLTKGDAIVEAMKDVRRAMIEDVFGEFRPYLIEMRAALHDADESRLRKLIVELEHKMFVEGVE